MANLDFGTTAVVEPNNTKIFGTADTAVHFEKLFAALKRAVFFGDNVVVFEDELEDYLLFVVSGWFAVARPAKTARVMSWSFISRRFFWLDRRKTVNVS